MSLTQTLPNAFIWDSNPAVWILILVVVVLLFGANKIPELARGLGKAKKEFKKAQDEIANEVDDALAEEDRKKKLEDEERRKIRAKLEREERAKLATGNSANTSSAANSTSSTDAA